MISLEQIEDQGQDFLYPSLAEFSNRTDAQQRSQTSGEEAKRAPEESGYNC
jgi:hypothetical protein